MSDTAIFRQMDYWMVVCRDKSSGEIVGWNTALYTDRDSALRQRRTMVGLREVAVRVRIVPKKNRRPS